MALANFIKTGNVRNAVLFLLNHKNDPKIMDLDLDGKPALFYALENRTLMDMIIVRSSINVTDKQGRTALHYVVESSNNMYQAKNLIRYLVKHGINPMIKDHDGNTAYDICIQRKLLDCSIFLWYYTMKYENTCCSILF